MKKIIEPKFVHDYAPDRKAIVEIKNAKLVDVVNGGYFKAGARILIQDGKIKALPGLSSSGSALKPDFTIDLKGKTVMPSLFNVHCHVSLAAPTLLGDFKDIRLAREYKKRQLEKNMADCLARGITNVRDAYSEDLDLPNSLRSRISSGEIPGPRIMQCVVVGPPGSYLNEKYNLVTKFLRSRLGMKGTDRDAKNAGVVEFPVDAKEKQIRDAVNRAIDERGAEVIKIGEQRENMTDFSPTSTIMKIEQLEALADQARKRGLRTTIHQVSVDTFRRAVQAGVSSMAHMAFDGKLTQKDIKGFIGARGIIEPTISVAYDLSWKVKDDPFADHPEMDLLTKFREKTYSWDDLAEDFYVPELRDGLKKSVEKIKTGNLKMIGLIDMTRTFRYYAGIIGTGNENLRMLFNSGATIALANDGGIPPCTPAMMGLELELYDLVMKGDPKSKQFDAKAAMRIATVNSARSMGLENKFGTIATGKIADLVVLDGDPFKNFRLIGSPVAALFMDGKLVINNCGLAVKSAKAK